MTNLDTGRARPLRDWPILLLRVYAGVFFLYYGFGKVRRGGGFADGLEGFVNSNLENAFGFFRPFLESVVLPNKGLFAIFVAWGELLIGLALILGLATRYAASAGAVMVACFWFAKGQGFLAAQNHDAIWFMIFIVLAGLHAGRVMSLDQKLVDRFRFLA
jgi:thiosulfate dehydrogenase [quinone] large subunit